MKTVIIYYSLSGHTKAFAEKLAEERGADLIRVEEVKKRSKLGAFFAVPGTISGKPAKIKPLTVDFSDIGKIIVAVPVWASHPARPFNNILEILPSGKDVELYFISAGSGTAETAEKTKAAVAARGCNITGYHDVTKEKN